MRKKESRTKFTDTIKIGKVTVIGTHTKKDGVRLSYSVPVGADKKDFERWKVHNAEKIENFRDSVLKKVSERNESIIKNLMS